MILAFFLVWSICTSPRILTTLGERPSCPSDPFIHSTLRRASSNDERWSNA